MDEIISDKCNGSRLKSESLCFKINDKDINELVNMEISELAKWFNNLYSNLSSKQKIIYEEIIK